jgi:pimeloyl-ACP methyl ester carboxylesterase
VARLGERAHDRVKRTSLRGAAGQLVAIARWSAQAPTDLSRIAQPTLVANREGDRMLATRGSFELAHQLPNARLVIYPDAGHGGVSSTTNASYQKPCSSCAEARTGVFERI